MNNPTPQQTSKDVHQLAKKAMDEAFGIGAEEAHQILRTNAAAKRIYDCALWAIEKLVLDKENPPANSFQLEAGKTYYNRLGHEVMVEELSMTPINDVHYRRGYRFEDALNRSYRPNGDYTTIGKHSYDLVKEVTPKPVFNANYEQEIQHDGNTSELPTHTA